MRTLPLQCRALLLLAAFGTACDGGATDPGGPSFAKAPAGPTVSSTVPGFASRDTTLDVRVLGAGFDNGSQAAFLLAGAADPNIATNSTQFVSSSELVANITVAANAVVDYRDVAVTTSGGKKGIGTAKFQVVDPIILQIPGAINADASDVNSSGQVVGHFNTNASTCTNRGFVWSEQTGVVTLPQPSGYCQARAHGINEAGVVSGTIWPTGGALGTTGVPVRWIPTGTATYSIGILPIPAPGRTLLENMRISGNGSVTAIWSNAGVSEPWLWQDGPGWIPLAPPGGGTACTTPWDINSADVVTGGGCVWTVPTAPPATLPLLPGATSAYGRGINNLGVVVGSLSFPARGNSSTSYLTRWVPDGSGGWSAENLGVVGQGVDVNADGVIVGTAFGMWTAATGATPLVALKGQSGTVYLRAISDRGPTGITWIVGYGSINGSGATSPFIWKR